MRFLPLPLRWSVPGALLVVGAVLVFLAVVNELERADDHSRATVASTARLTGNLKAPQLEAALRRGGPAEARGTILRMNVDPNLRFAAVVDPGGRIVVSTQRELEGRSISTAGLGEELPEAADVWSGTGEALAPTVESDRMVAVFPVLLPGPGLASSPSRRGMLVAQYDLSRLRAAAHRDAAVHVARFVVVLLLLGGLAWGYYHRSITRRVETLVRRAQTVGRGASLVKPELEGGDEFSRLDRALVTMSREIETHTAQLRERDELFRQLTENMREAFWIRSADGKRLIYLSSGCGRLWGMDTDLLRQENGRRWIASLHPADRRRVRSRLEQTPESEYEMEYRIQRPDGELRWIRDRVFPIRDDSGEVFRMGGLVEDITDRKEAAERLRANESRLRLLVRRIPAVLWTTDRALEITANEGRAAGGIGVEPGSLVGRSIAVVARAARSPELSDAHLRAIGTGRPQEFEASWGRRVFQGHVDLLRDRAGSVTGTIGIALDVTERRVAERAARDSEERYRELLEQAADGIFALDHQGRIVRVNPRGSEMFGRPARELMGRSLEDLLAPAKGTGSVSDRDASLRFDEIHTGQSVLLERTIVQRDAPPLQVEISAKMLQDGRIQCIFRDITPRRQLEERLRHSQKMEAVGQLAGGVAHDFNNLITVIKGHAELLSLELDGDDARMGEVRQISNAADRAARLTRQLLAFGRGQVTRPRVLDLAALIRGMREMLQRMLREDVRLVTHLPSVPCRVSMDPSQMEQVVINLCLNARDAMPRGGELTISVRTVEEVPLPAVPRPGVWREGVGAPGSVGAGPDPGGVLLEVADTGMGIDRETLSRIFEPFFTTKGPGKGTGLGLATVYGIVQQNGGTVDVESERGRGARFTIHLPAVVGEEEREAPRPRNGPPRGSGTILVVEDEDAVRTLTCRALERAGFDVMEASSGEDAREIVLQKGTGLDLVLTDVVMPGLRGTELAAWLEQVRPGLPVVLMSGYAEEFREGRGERDGRSPAVGFIAKPFEPRELVELLTEVLAARRRGGEGPVRPSPLR